MVGPLLTSEFRLPAERPGAVARRRLAERLDARSPASLTVLSAPAGFGKTTLLTAWLAAASARGTAVAWLSLDRERQRPRAVLDLRRERCAGRPAGRRQHGGAAARVVRTDRDRPRRAAQRHRGRAGRCRARPGRLPPRRLAARPRRHHVPARAPTGPVAGGARDARRPAAPAAAAARTRRAGGDPGRRPAVHLGRGRRVPHRLDGPRPERGRRPRARGPHRGLDRRTATGRLVVAGSPRCQRVHRGLRPATIATSWTTSPRRSSPASRRTSANSSSAPRSSSDSPARCATR